jgi:hypothetical protein
VALTAAILKKCSREKTRQNFFVAKIGQDLGGHIFETAFLILTSSRKISRLENTKLDRLRNGNFEQLGMETDFDGE